MYGYLCVFLLLWKGYCLAQPSLQPIIKPSSQPSRQPSSQPSLQPSLNPSIIPDYTPMIVGIIAGIIAGSAILYKAYYYYNCHLRHKKPLSKNELETKDVTERDLDENNFLL